MPHRLFLVRAFICTGLVCAAASSLWSAEASGLIAPDAKVEKLSGGFQFTEGPAHDTQGNIYFSDIPNSRIHVWSLDGKLSTFRENSGQSNGLEFDAKGNLIACEGGTRALTSTTADGNKTTVLADRYDGKKLNSPNDLWIDSKGGIYFSDPRYGRQAGVEQDGHHVYYLTPQKKLVRVINDMKKPNGLVGTADGKRLYVTDEGGDKTYVYDIAADGSLSGKKLLVEKGSDGMTLDSKGNLYLTNESVWIYSPEGTLLEEIKLPEGAANVCFGGADHKTLFITARKGLYSLRMNVPGW